ncbi:hypothetical protein BC827DRAFT_1128499 [Russula dissimulans]|nr:hypothetical protein BC827DRAFT_1128499 [Russula dissimulans]
MRSTLILLGLCGLARSAQIYFHPPVPGLESLQDSHASAVVAKHLHLDRFEPLQDFYPGPLDQSFVGKGPSSSLLIGIDDVDAEHTIPAEDLTTPVSFLSSSPASTFSRILQTSLERAHLAFSHIFDVSSGSRNMFFPLLDIMKVSPPTETFISDLSALASFLESDDLSSDRFGAFRMTGLRTIADAYGRESEQYRTAAASLAAALRSALTKPHLNVAIFTYPETRVSAGGVERRQDQDQDQDQSPLPPPVPVPPVDSDALCFASEEVCSNSTDSCTGHGVCAQAIRAGRTCFACVCEATKDSNGQTQYWAGSKCERKDVSGPFVLITGTVITLLLIVVGSIALLSGVGSQPLPSVLTSSVPSISVRE